MTNVIQFFALLLYISPFTVFPWSEGTYSEFLRLTARRAKCVIAKRKLSVCLFVTCWYCTQANADRITRSSLWDSKNTLVFLQQQSLGVTYPCTCNLQSKWLTSVWKAPTWPISDYNIWTVTASEKIQLSRIGSRPHTFHRAIDEVRTLPLMPQNGGSKVNSSFLWIKI